MALGNLGHRTGLGGMQHWVCWEMPVSFLGDDTGFPGASDWAWWAAVLGMVVPWGQSCTLPGLELRASLWQLLGQGPCPPHPKFL